MMQIFLNPYKTLHTKSTPFDFNEGLLHYQDLEKFEHDFATFMINSKGIGLAANQIGITKRFFCMGDPSFDKIGKPVIMWNPSIVRESVEKINYHGT